MKIFWFNFLNPLSSFFGCILILVVEAFKQQQLRSWQPILTPIPVIITFLVVGIVFIPIGIACIIASDSVIFR